MMVMMQLKKEQKKTEIAIPLKHLGNFWRSLDMPLINCEVSLTLTWDKNCVITTLEKRVIPGSNPVRRGNSLSGASFKITSCELCLPVVTLSKDDDNELLNHLKSGFKRVVTWNKYLSQISNRSANNNLNFLGDPTFTDVNKLFVLSFKSDNENRDNRTSFSKYYLPEVQIKDFNVIIDKTSFFDQPVKNEEEAHEKIIEIGRNSEYNTGNLLDYEYFKKYYRLIAVDLSKQNKEEKDLRQQINFIGRLEKEATMFFIIEKREETIILLLLYCIIVLYK